MSCPLAHPLLTRSDKIALFGVLAELAVAWVIYYELKQNRRLSFLDKVAQESANEDRETIYEEYAQLNGPFSNFEARRRVFTNWMMVHPALKARCDRQITLFNDIGITVGGWSVLGERLVTVFPHAAIYIWMILGDYILTRRRNTGNWFATPMMVFTLRCVNFVLQRIPGLRLYGGDITLEIDATDLQRLRIEIERELSLRSPEYILRRIVSYRWRLFGWLRYRADPT